MSEIRYPFKEMGARAALSREEARALNQQAADGGVRTPPTEAKAFIKEAYKTVFTEKLPTEIPTWVLALVKKQATPEEVLDTLKKRVLRAPTETNLRLALSLINDLLRQPGGSEAVQKVLSQETLNRIKGTEYP